VEPGKDGYALDGAVFRQKILAAKLHAEGQTTIAMEVETSDPEITTDAAQALADTVAKNTGDGLTFALADQTYVADRATVASWLTFDKNDAAKALEVKVDPEALSKYLVAALGDTANVPVKDTVITTVNGFETGRTAGTSGQVLDYAAAAIDVLASVTQGGEDIAVKTIEVKPKVVADSSEHDYPELRAQLAKDFGNRPYAVVVVDVSGKGRDFAVNPDKVFTTASTYKLFVAYSMLTAVENGTSWNSSLAGTTLSTCFQRMIVNSDNACPEAWLSRKSFKGVEKQARSIGASSTLFTVGNLRTTPRDLATMLSKVYAGTIMSPESNKRLTDTMKVQQYRDGIPKGIGANGVVADKVGFLNGYLHDAGIVYSDQGDYVMVIMTERSSWGQIAETAKAVNAAMTAG
jgi:beta-lactamase class A